MNAPDATRVDDGETLGPQSAATPRDGADSSAAENLDGQVVPVARLLDDFYTLDAPHLRAKCSWGDYELVREIGHGAMGIVYEAEEKRSGRRVALKMLPRLAASSPQLRCRFENEIMAVTSLNHPHVLPIHASGRVHESPYYTMPLVHGESLAAVIYRLSAPAESGTAQQIGFRDLRAPGTAHYYRAAAHLAQQAAEALQHAHDAELVHRDIKPSNLLVTARGHLWVTDFGLARLPLDTGLTASGDLVGTLRFMSPEQALGKPVAIDHRTDIYSLGATLYELLTLHPAFGTQDRQFLLRQLAAQEPPPPRSLQPAIPRDLETIVLKAMAKEPGLRYQQAGEMAEDLRRFLDDEPIAARRPTWGDRIARFARRHATTLLASILPLLVLTAILTTATLMITQERNVARLAAQRERAAADMARRQWNYAEQQRRHAEASFQRAHAVVDRMFIHADEELANVPRSDAVRHALLEDALDSYASLCRDRPAETGLHRDMAQALNRVGEIHVRLGNRREAEQAYKQAAEMLAQLTAIFPDRLDYQRQWSENLRDLAAVLEADPEQRDAAEGLLLSRVQQIARLQDRFPEQPQWRSHLTEVRTDLASFLARRGHFARAEAEFMTALADGDRADAEAPLDDTLREARWRTLHGLGKLLLTASRAEEARRYLIDANALRGGVVREACETKSACSESVQIACELGKAECQQGDPRSAEEHFRRAISIAAELVRDFPDTVTYREQLANAWHGLYCSLTAQGRPEARAALDQASELLDQVVNPTEGSLTQRLALADIRFDRGLLEFHAGRRAAAQADFRQCGNILERCVQQFPAAGDALAQLADFRASVPDDAYRDFDTALRLSEQAARCDPEHPYTWRARAAALYRSGEWLASIAAVEESQRLKRGADAFDAFYLALAYARLGNVAQAETYYAAAVEKTQVNRCQQIRVFGLQQEAQALGLDASVPAPVIR